MNDKKLHMISGNIFLELSKKVQNLGFKQSLSEIAKISFDEMKINRLSIWRVKDKTNLYCEFKRTRQLEEHHCFDCNINLDLVPTFNKFIHEGKIILAHDACAGNYTYELKDYFLKNTILSIMIIPIFVDGLLFGVVAFETVDNYHQWQSSDLNVGSDISQIISIAFISSKRNDNFNMLNSYAEKIKTYNKELEEVIKMKNEQFVEYGFINSHLLNAPLSRLKGLLNLLVLEMNGHNRREEINFIISKIYEAYEEMDKIVDKISLLIEKGEDIDREDLTA